MTSRRLATAFEIQHESSLTDRCLHCVATIIPVYQEPYIERPMDNAKPKFHLAFGKARKAMSGEPVWSLAAPGSQYLSGSPFLPRKASGKIMCSCKTSPPVPHPWGCLRIRHTR